MNKKTNAFSKNPYNDSGNDATISQEDAEDWVKNDDKEEMTRLTFYVPKSWHSKIKSQCAAKGINMTQAISPLLKDFFSL